MVEDDGKLRADNCFAEEGIEFPFFKYERMESSTSCFVYFAFFVFMIIIFAAFTNESKEPKRFIITDKLCGKTSKKAALDSKVEPLL